MQHEASRVLGRLLSAAPGGCGGAAPPFIIVQCGVKIDCVYLRSGTGSLCRGGRSEPVIKLTKSREMPAPHTCTFFFDFNLLFVFDEGGCGGVVIGARRPQRRALGPRRRRARVQGLRASAPHYTPSLLHNAKMRRKVYFALCLFEGPGYDAKCGVCSCFTCLRAPGYGLHVKMILRPQ